MQTFYFHLTPMSAIFGRIGPTLSTNSSCADLGLGPGVRQFWSKTKIAAVQGSFLIKTVLDQDCAYGYLLAGPII